jgi:hypothetical protein
MCEVEEKNRRLGEENERLRVALKAHRDRLKSRGRQVKELQDYIKQMLADARS